MTLRLNLGSGTHETPPGWLAIDCLPQPARVDVYADVAALPFADHSADALMASHLLEHIPLDAMGAVLAEWRRVLRPDGVLAVVGPDQDRAVEMRGNWPLLDAIRKHGEGPGAHAWTATAEVTRWLLALHGWAAEEVPVQTLRPPEWANPAADVLWQFAFLARPV